MPCLGARSASYLKCESAFNQKEALVGAFFVIVKNLQRFVGSSIRCRGQRHDAGTDKLGANGDMVFTAPTAALQHCTAQSCSTATSKYLTCSVHDVMLHSA